MMKKRGECHLFAASISFSQVTSILDVANTAGLLAGDIRGYGSEWCFYGDRGVRICADALSCGGVPPRKIAHAGSLI